MRETISHLQGVGKKPARTPQEHSVAYAFASAIRGYMRRSGPSAHQSYNPPGGDSAPCGSTRGFLLTVQGKSFYWDHVRPLVASAKRRNSEFRLLMEKDDILPVHFLNCVDDLLRIYRQLEAIN